MYGYEVIIDLNECDKTKFNRKCLRKYFKDLCKLIDMVPCRLVFWDDVGVPEKDKQILSHTKGTSAVQFIITSNITVHTLDILGSVYINIFSCKDSDKEKARDFTKEFFRGKIVSYSEVVRK